MLNKTASNFHIINQNHLKKWLKWWCHRSLQAFFSDLQIHENVPFKCQEPIIQ